MVSRSRDNMFIDLDVGRARFSEVGYAWYCKHVVRRSAMVRIKKKLGVLT